jgi:hypothetical protein
MKIIWVGCILFLTTAACGSGSPPPAKTEETKVPKVVIQKEKTEREKPLPPEVKIRLRRDGKENYSWELNGTDADQILKVNEKMRKELGGEKTR